MGEDLGSWGGGRKCEGMTLHVLGKCFDCRDECLELKMLVRFVINEMTMTLMLHVM
jgi:hypothetical protein